MTDTRYGVTSMAGTLRRVGMRRPGAILTADPARWHYGKDIDADALVAQYDHFVSLIEASGTNIEWIDADDNDDLADSIFTYDPSFVLGDGAVILRPGKPLRAAEADLHRRFYEGRMPVIGTIEAPGTIEGGDCFWLDPTTLAVGRGFRTNQSGIDQLRSLLAPSGVEVRAYDLPYLHGPESCLHLMSVISPLDRDLALVYAPLLPTALFEDLRDLGYELLHAPAAEFDASMGLNLNVLALAPRRCLAVAGFPDTLALMLDANCEVATFDADELCLPCEGGPTCLTRPLWRTL